MSAPQGITTLFASFLLCFAVVTCLYGAGIGKGVVCAKRAERKINKVEQLCLRLLIRRLVIARVQFTSTSTLFALLCSFSHTTTFINSTDSNLKYHKGAHLGQIVAIIEQPEAAIILGTSCCDIVFSSCTLYFLIIASLYVGI